MSVLPNLYSSADVVSLQRQLYADTKATDDSVRACAALDQPTRASWGLFYVQVSQLMEMQPGSLFNGAIVDQVQSLQTQLFAWQQKLSKVCALTLPPSDPSAPKPGDPNLLALGNIFKWLAIGAAAVGGAYVVGKGLSLLPAPSRK